MQEAGQHQRATAQEVFMRRRCGRWRRKSNCLSQTYTNRFVVTAPAFSGSEHLRCRMQEAVEQQTAAAQEV